MKIRVLYIPEKCYMEVIADRKNMLCLNHGYPLFRLPIDVSERRYGVKQNRDDHPFATLSNIIGSPDFYQIEEVDEDLITDNTVASIPVIKNLLKK